MTQRSDSDVSNESGGCWQDPPAPRSADPTDRDFARRFSAVVDSGSVVFPDRYEVVKELGRGGIGVVYLARDRQWDRLAALKVVPKAFAESGRLRTEAEVIAKLQHPNIVRIHEIFDSEKCYGLDLEYVAGGSLAHHLAGKLLESHQAAALVADLAAAVEAAHQAGVVHRDLKPANVLLQVADGKSPSEKQERTRPVALDDRNPEYSILNSAVPKITDFGLARILDRPGVTQTGQMLGTPSYMAPEQARGAKEAGPSADIFSLGAILYECLTGRPPFRSVSTADTLAQVLNMDPVPPHQLNPLVPRNLEAVCLKCLAKQPNLRYPSSKELEADLRRFLAGQPTQARPLNFTGRAIQSARRRPALAGLIAVSVTAIIAGLLGLIIHTTRMSAALRRAEAGESAAMEQKELARSNYRRAKETMDRMLQLIEARKSSGVPRIQQLWRDQQTEALSFFRAIAARANDVDPEVQFDAARASYEAGRLQLALGQSDQAGEDFKRSIALLGQLINEHPYEPNFQAALATSWNGLGNWHQTKGRHDESLAAHREALRIRTQLARDSGGRRELAEAEFRLGTAGFSANQFTVAEQHLRQALKLASELGADETARRLRANVCLNLSVLLQSRPDITESRNLAEKAESELLSLLKELPGDPSLTVALASLRINWGYVMTQGEGSAIAAVDRLKPSIDALVQLYRLEPQSESIRMALRDCHGATAQFLEHASQWEKAVEAWERVVALDSSEQNRHSLAAARAKVSVQLKTGRQ